MAPLAILLAFTPLPGSAAGSMQHQRNKDFRELIVKGERPEIAACLVAAVDYARHSPDFFAVRWSDDESDHAIMQESETNDRFTRSIRLVAQMRKRSPIVFSGTWQSVEVSCVQQQDGVVQVKVKATPG